MEANDQAPQQELKNDEEPWLEDSGQQWEEEQAEPKSEDETMVTVKEEKDPPCESGKLNVKQNKRGETNVFVNGLSVGLGIGCIVTFVIMWLAVFFSPQLPSGATYQTMLSIFIYPMVYLLAVGLIALTAGIVREYYVPRVNG
ncbi:MAG: hypothetical protein ABSD73_00925 [Candidatus Bathyarchaeia archaeon]|jgi:hypothetical protein